MEFIREENRIYCLNEKNKIIAEVTFKKICESVIEINHTFVDESLRGQGIANLLLMELVKLVNEKQYKCVPICSYSVKWFERHPEYSYLLK